MIVKCPACLEQIGHTDLYTVEEAVAEHVCLASDQDYENAVNWVRFNQIVGEM